MKRRRPADSEERRLFEEAISEIERLDEEELVLRKSFASRPETTRRHTRLERRLSRGARPEASLDLHRLDRREAQRRLQSFLASRRRDGIELVLIVHGKGRRILARLVCEELERHPDVAEHRSAPRVMGGEGARVARLRRHEPLGGGRSDPPTPSSSS